METLLSLGDCWDETALAAHREEIIDLTVQKRRLCEQSGRYLAAAGALLSGTYRLALEATDTGKIERLAERIAAVEFKGGPARRGTERVRLLSALTADGYVMLHGTAGRLAQRIYLLEDEHGPSAALLLAALRRRALAAGWELLCCTSPFAPYERLEHLFIPALSLGFMTRSDCLDPAVLPCRVINARRFTDKAVLSTRKKRISFNKKAARQMIAQAQTLLGEAGEAHRRLEAIYTPAMDFSAVDALTDRLIQRLLG